MKLYIYKIALFALLFSFLPLSAKEKTMEFTISFNGNRTVIDKSYKSNDTEIDRLSGLLSTVSNNPGFKISDIKIAGYTSPEGTHEDNKRISGERREAVATFITEKGKISSRLLSYDNEYIPWEWLKNEISASNHPYKYQGLALLNRPGQFVRTQGNFTTDKRLYDLKRLGNGSLWNYLSSKQFPQMNQVKIIVHILQSDMSPELETLMAMEGDISQDVITTQPATSPLPITNPVPATPVSKPNSATNTTPTSSNSTANLPQPVPTSQLSGTKYIDFELPDIDHNSAKEETPTPSVTPIDPTQQAPQTALAQTSAEQTPSTSENNGTMVVTPETLIIRPGKIIIQTGESVFEHDGDFTIESGRDSRTYTQNSQQNGAKLSDQLLYSTSTYMPRGHIKTNLVQWALTQVNAAIDFDFGPHWSFSLPVAYCGWNYFQYDLKFRTLDIKPEFRYWTRRSNTGFYVGAHAGFVLFNYAFKGEYRYTNQDRNMPTIGGGLSLGYRVPISRNGHWAMEFGVSGGVYYVQYSRYENVPGGYPEGDYNKTYYGLDGASISFIYSFDLRKK